MSSMETTIDRAHLVINIQDGFGLAMADLADVLRVPRGEFVAWLNRDQASASDPRIERLAFLASWWHSRSGRGLSEYLRDPVNGRSSLIEMLRAEVLDERAITAVLAALVMRTGRAPGAPSQTHVVPSAIAPTGARVTHLADRRRA